MKIVKSNLSYSGKKVFVGIDVHRRTYSIACVVDGELVKRWRMPAYPEKLAHMLKKSFLKGEVRCVYEAGFSGFVLHRALAASGIENMVINPASLETEQRNRVKTDKKDATKLARQLAAGRLNGIRIPDEDEENRRLLTRTRQQLVKQQTRTKLFIRAKLHLYGLLAPEDKREMSKSYLEEILEGELVQELRTVLEIHFAIWDALAKQILVLQKKLKEQAQKDPNELIYRSVPGIGPLSSRILSNELGDMTQFANERQLFSYTGLTPSEHSSGENVRRGHISRQGKGILRHVLVEAAWRAVRSDEELRSCFEALAKRTGKSRAIIAVARKLIGRTRAALCNGKCYAITAA